MPILVRLTVENRDLARYVRLPELPKPGDLIQLGDGSHVIVETVERATPDTGAEADVRARPAG